MTRTDWENVARCAKERRQAHVDDNRRWIAEWYSWQAAQELSGRTPF